MVEHLKFVFDGKLAAQNAMDFYEASRFQYAASRLLVKLDNFRTTGTFPKNITYKNAADIRILPPYRGSYGMEVIGPALAAAAPLVYELPLGYLFSYVVDRIFRSGNDDDIRAALAHNDRLLETFNRNVAERDDTVRRTLDLLRDQMEDNREQQERERQLFERLLADQQRKEALQRESDILRRISDEEEAELVTMAAPLLKQMNVPLRRSARTLTISAATNDNNFLVLSANKEMADAVDTEIVDRRLTRIDINVVQFNKESGWGKFENDDWEGRPSFYVPGEALENMRQTVVNAMHKDLVEADCYFVRSKAGIPRSIIISDMRDIDE